MFCGISGPARVSGHGSFRVWLVVVLKASAVECCALRLRLLVIVSVRRTIGMVMAGDNDARARLYCFLRCVVVGIHTVVRH